VEETFFGFAFENDGAGEQTVLSGVLRGVGLPWAVTGPRDFAPLARDALICFSVRIFGLNMAWVGRGFGDFGDGC